MKIKIRTEELSRALYKVQGIADKRSSTQPILSHVLLRTEGEDSLICSATNHDIGLTGSYNAEIEEEGAITLPAKQLFDVVKSLPADTLELSVLDNNWAQVLSGKSKFKLAGVSAEEFPEQPEPEDVERFSIATDILLQMIDRTLFCVSQDDNRHNLGGVYCEPVGDRTLRMVSTDGHRLAMAETKLNDPLPFSSGVIVPRKGFLELKRILSDGRELVDEVQISFSKSAGVFHVGGAQLFTRLIEGAFPNYNQVIPKQCAFTAVISRAHFADSLRRVALLSNSHTFGVVLEFSSGSLRMLTEDPELGTANETIDINYDGEPLSIRFNSRYVLDVLTLIKEDGVRFMLSDSLAPGVIKPVAEEDNFLAVVMPIRM